MFSPSAFVRSRTVLAIALVVSWLVAGSRLFAQAPRQSTPDAPLPGNEAAASMIVPKGFHVSLFAGEPDCRQPIGMCIDDRGRVWIAEAYNYPKHGTSPGDRILIFEDTDGDGSADKRTVFYDQLNYVTGIEVGFGGVWVVSPPFFFFIADRNHDDVPDAEPEILLDGLGNHANPHNLANALAWGPDGWLYGTHGRTNWSKFGKPGTPESQRLIFDGGVYRYHPTRHVVEPFADGTTNPWQLDWNDMGDAFICNCVTPHLYQVIQGAHYDPWRNRDSSQYAYDRVPTIADHLHFLGTTDVRATLGSAEEDQAGGGHAHCGTMIYLGDNWPSEYRNTLFTHNIHGHRINNDILHRKGSGYTASHGRDLMRSRDAWYMGVVLQYGPDGSVFSIDWSDTGECHSYENTRRATGRVYKITYADAKHVPVDLASQSNLALAELQRHKNDWFVRHARRLLQERALNGQDVSDAKRRLSSMLQEETDVSRKLRALWCLHAMGCLEDSQLQSALSDSSENLRAWGIRLSCEDGHPGQNAVEQMLELAQTDESSYVRLELACALQRIAPAHRWDLATRLVQHAEDGADQNIPLLLWYGIEPLARHDASRFWELARTSRIPIIARYAARRLFEEESSPAALENIIRNLTQLGDELQAEILTGFLQGLEGHRRFPMPANWSGAYPELMSSGDERIRDQAMKLALVFDDPAAIKQLREIAVDTSRRSEARSEAIRVLASRQVENLAPLLLQLVEDSNVRRAAIQALADYDDPRTSALILSIYPQLDAEARQDAMQTLASRRSWASDLVEAIEQGRLDKAEMTAYTARQLYSFDDADLSDRVRRAWGELRSTPQEKTTVIAKYKDELTKELLDLGDRAQGRRIFQKTCAACHKLFDAGGNIGPNITGSQRHNLDYLLQTIVDPSAAVARDFQMHAIETSDGRMVTGIIVNETKMAITVQTVTERIVIPTAEVENKEASPLSMMPEGMLQNLSLDQVRDLFAYLMGREQVEAQVEKTAR